MKEKEILLTKEQFAKAEEDLSYFVNTKRPEVVERIKQAKSFGDLSENSEYDSAREEQAFIEAKIKELEVMISRAKIIEKNEDTSTISLGNIVKIKYLDSGKTSEFRIVATGGNPFDDEDPSISVSSAIGKVLVGKKKNAVVEAEVPNGIREIKIMSIKSEK